MLFSMKRWVSTMGCSGDIIVERAFCSNLPELRFDPEQMRRVAVNLVDNAVDALEGSMRMSPDGERGVIRVQTAHNPRAGVVRLVVEDNGPGISEADRERLFLPYFSTKRRGSGLGLAIVRRIVVEHGGNIRVGDHSPRGREVYDRAPVLTRQIGFP